MMQALICCNGRSTYNVLSVIYIFAPGPHPWQYAQKEALPYRVVSLYRRRYTIQQWTLLESLYSSMSSLVSRTAQSCRHLLVTALPQPPAKGVCLSESVCLCQRLERSCTASWPGAGELRRRLDVRGIPGGPKALMVLSELLFSQPR